MLRAIRGTFIALGLTGMVAAFLRVRGSGDNTPPHLGGWRELSGPDLR